MAHVLAGAPPELAAPAFPRRFSHAAWIILAYNILVVLWGAFVRATGSGAGCGNHWPLCNGSVVPRAATLETAIEFTHRMTSAVSLAAVIGLASWAFRSFPRGHRARLFASLSVVFLLTEALLGAGLVLFQYVEHNASIGRAIYLSAHLLNTQILLAMLALTAWFGARFEPRLRQPVPKLILAALPASLIVAVSGAIAALGDTLFPASSLASGIQQEFSATASLLLRLRLLHPVLAVAGGVVVMAAAASAWRTGRPSAARTGGAALLLVLLQLGAGVLNVALLAPAWLQILHLLLADLLWIALVLLALEAGECITASS